MSTALQRWRASRPSSSITQLSTFGWSGRSTSKVRSQRAAHSASRSTSDSGSGERGRVDPVAAVDVAQRVAAPLVGQLEPAPAHRPDGTPRSTRWRCARVGPVQFDVQVEVRLREGVADPQGQTIERSLPHLGFDGVQGVRVGKSIRFGLEAADEAAARAEVDDMCARFLTNPVIEDAEVTIRVAGAAARDEGRRRPVPGLELRAGRLEAVRYLGGDAELLWHGDRTVGGVDAVIVPGRLRPRRLPAPGRDRPLLPGDGGGRRPRRRRRAGRRDLQRLPGAHRGRSAAGRAAEEPGPVVPLHHRRGAGGVDRSALTSEAAVGSVLRIPINHFEGNYTCGPGHPRSPSSRGPDRPALRRQPERVGRRHRGHLQRGRATWSGSCPTRSGPCTPSSGRPTACRCCSRC